jgi:hypothetical protein
MSPLFLPLYLGIAALVGFCLCAFLMLRISGIGKTLREINLSQTHAVALNALKAELAERPDARAFEALQSELTALKALVAEHVVTARAQFDGVESDFEMAKSFTAQTLTALYARHLHTWAMYRSWQVLVKSDEALESRPYDAQFFFPPAECHADLTVFRQLQQQIQPIAASQEIEISP